MATKTKQAAKPSQSVPEPPNQFAQRTIVSRLVSSLKLDPENARKHGDADVDAIARSLSQFGQQTPLVIDSTGTIAKGNGTYMAATKLGWQTVECIETSLSGAALRAYAIADNRTAELSSWDNDRLLEQLQGFEDAALQAATGYDEPALLKLLAEFGNPEDLPELAPELAEPDLSEDDLPELPAVAITQPGDLWLMGDHRLLCGDSTNPADVTRLMDGNLARLCFTSPPYGQQRDYTKEGKEKCLDWDSLMLGVYANLPMAEDGQVLVNLGMIHKDGEWSPYWDQWLSSMRELGWRRFGMYIWDQGEGLPGHWQGRMSPCFELIFHFNKASVQPRKWVPTKNAGKVFGTPGMKGKDGKSSSTGSNADAVIADTKIPSALWRYTRAHTAGKVESEHPAVYPVELPLHAMKSWDGLAYEPFSGSGTTIMAAEAMGRSCFAMEISPQYCDVAVQRWENKTGLKAVRVAAN